MEMIGEPFQMIKAACSGFLRRFFVVRTSEMPGTDLLASIFSVSSAIVCTHEKN